MISKRCTWAWKVPGVLAGVVLTTLAPALPSTAEAKPIPPQLSIAVDDGRDYAAPGESLSYRITVTNLGTKSVSDLRITQTAPEVATLLSADHRGRSTAGTVSWAVHLAPGDHATLQTSVALAGTLPSDLLRLATVACARTGPQAQPIVCASDSDQLPAGASAEQQGTLPDQPSAAVGAWWPLPGAMVLAGLLLAMVIAVVIILRRHSRLPDSPEPGIPAENPAVLVSSSRR